MDPLATAQVVYADWAAIGTAIAAIIIALGTALPAIWTARAARKEARDVAAENATAREAAKEAARLNSEEVGQIHEKVNGQKTATDLEIAGLRALVEELRTSLYDRLEERAERAEKRAERAEGGGAVVD